MHPYARTQLTRRRPEQPATHRTPTAGAALSGALPGIRQAADRNRPESAPASSAPLRVFFDPTAQCNLRCRHCRTDASPDAPTETDLSLDRIRSLFLELALAGAGEIVIGGGEPLVHPAILTILGDAKEAGLSVILETNGVLIDDETAGALAALRLTEIWIGFDGAEQAHDAIRGRDTYRKALDGAARLVRNCADPVARLTISRHSLARIEALFEDMATAGVTCARPVVIRPEGRAALPENRDLLAVKPDRKMAERLLECGVTYGITVELPPDDFIGVDEIPALRRRERHPSGTCGAGFATAYIAPSGEVFPCAGMRSASFGSIAARPFSEVWQGVIARTFRKAAAGCGAYRLCEAACFRSGQDTEVPAPAGAGVRFVKQQSEA
jgi:radical SAM protein with 4Fe4S-binding SPASM domain